MLKDTIQALLKDRNLMEGFLQGRLQLEGVTNIERQAIYDILGNLQTDNKDKGVLVNGGWY